MNTIINKLSDWYSQLYWWIFDYVEITVKWPSGEIVVDHNDPRWADLGGAVWIGFESADPNDHYRPDLELNVGKQGLDWDWHLKWHGRNIETGENVGRLTIRFRKSKSNWAAYYTMKWG